MCSVRTCTYDHSPRERLNKDVPSRFAELSRTACSTMEYAVAPLKASGYTRRFRQQQHCNMKYPERTVTPQSRRSGHKEMFIIHGSCVDLPYHAGWPVRVAVRTVSGRGLLLPSSVWQRNATKAQSERNMLGEGHISSGHISSGQRRLSSQGTKHSLTFGVVIHTTTTGYRHEKQPLA